MVYRTYSLHDVLYCTIIAATISASLGISTGGSSFGTIIVVLVLVFASLAMGRSILLFANARFGVAFEFLLGMLTLNVVILAVSLLFSISAGYSSLIVMAVVLFMTTFLCVRSKNLKNSITNKQDLLVLVLVCIGSFIWSWQAIEALPRLIATGRFDAWTDYFIHSAEVSQFSNFEALGGRSIFAAGAALPPYHYGSYMIPSAICSLTGVPALSAITAIWTPLGFIMLGLGAYVLGTQFRNKNSGLLSIIGIFLVPSAAYYGLKDPFFDFHWLLQVSSSGCYGIAAACLSISALLIWIREKRLSMLWMAAILTLLVAEFRVQIFIPLAITDISIFFVAWHPRRPLFRRLLFALCLALVLAAMLGMEQLPRAPHFFSGAHHPIRSLLLMLGMKPSIHSGLYSHLIAAAHPSGTTSRQMWQALILIVGLVLLLISAFGAILPVYTFGVVSRYFCKIKETSDYIPLIGILVYITVVLTFPDTAEPLEFAHRPYVLFYTLCIIWCAAYTSDILSYFLSESTISILVIALAILLLSIPLKLERSAQTSRLAWYDLYSDVVIPENIMISANYLRVHSAPGQVVAMENNPMADVFLALSERPEFYPGTEFLKIQSGLSGTQVADREAITDEILSSPQSAASKAIEQRFNICWIVRIHPGSARQSSDDPTFESLSVSMINRECH